MSSKNIVDLRREARRRLEAAARPRTPAPSTAQAGKNSPLRAKRHRVRVIALGICAVLMIVGVCAASYVSYLPQYTINTVEIVGVQTVPRSLVARYVDTQLNTGTRSFFARNNIFLFDTSALARNIVGFFPRIKSAKVSRASLIATAITVMVQERQEFAQWCTDTRCYSMDDTGFIFAQADPKSDMESATSTEQRSMFSGGFATTSNPIGQVFAPGHLPGIIAFFDQLGQAGLSPVGATVDDYGSDFTAHLTEGFDIKASFGQDPDALVRDLQLILGSDTLKDKQADIQYIDLRFGDRTYYKLKGIDATLTQP